MSDKSHVIIIIITTQGQIVQNIECCIQFYFSRATWSTCELQVLLGPTKRNVLERTVRYLVAPSDDKTAYTCAKVHCWVLIVGSDVFIVLMNIA